MSDLYLRDFYLTHDLVQCKFDDANARYCVEHTERYGNGHRVAISTLGSDGLWRNDQSFTVYSGSKLTVAAVVRAWRNYDEKVHFAKAG